MLEAQLEGIEDRTDRVRVLREVAELQQKLARVDNAFDTRSRAWLVDVSNADTLADMESLALSAKLYGPLVQTLQEGAQLSGDPELQARLWARSATVLEAQLHDPGQAIDAWRQALEARPDDVDSFQALERLLAAGNRTAELAEVLEKHLEVATSATDRKEIGKRIAVLYDQALKQRDRAIEAWRAVLDIDETDMDALDALGRLYVANLAWRELAEVLQRKIELTPDPLNLRLMRLTCARLFDDRLSEPQEALTQLRAVLDISPGDAEALDSLDRILTREGQHADLLEVLDQRAAIEVNPAARAAIAVRAAHLLGEELSDVEGAIGRYRTILGDTPDNQEARQALWRIARGEDFRQSAIAALEPLLRAGAEWPQVVELLELKLAVEDAPLMRVEILSEIAAIEERERGDAAAAFKAWSRAFAEEVTEAEPRQALERLAAASDDWAGLAGVYEERLTASFDAGLQRSLAMRLGELYEGRLGDQQRALEFYRKAAETAGDEGPVLSALERVLGALKRPGELAEVLQRKSEVTTDPVAAGGNPGAARPGAAGPGRHRWSAGCVPRGPGEGARERRARARRCAVCCTGRKRARACWTFWSRWRRAGAITTSWWPCSRCAWPRERSRPSGRCGCGASPRSRKNGWGRPSTRWPRWGGRWRKSRWLARPWRRWSGWRASRGGRPRRPASSRRRCPTRIPPRHTSWPCGRLAFTRASPASARRPSGCTRVSWLTIPRTSTRSRRWRRSIARAAIVPRWQGCWSGAPRSSSIPRSRRERPVRGGASARGAGGHPGGAGGLADLAPGGGGRRRGAGGDGAPVSGPGEAR